MKLVTLLVGCVMGAAVAEGVLRAVLYEHEIDRSYWGRGAFVADEELSYRHAPGETVTVGRYFGGFASHPVTFNEHGYRDHREGPGNSDHTTRILVAGSSNMVGIGVPRYEDLFHVQLEKFLNERSGRRTYSTFNISQTGYVASMIMRVAQRETPRYDPHMVVMVLHPRSIFLNYNLKIQNVDVVNGYRLPRDRILRNGITDQLRTRSWAVQRVVTTPVLDKRTAYDELCQMSIIAAAGGMFAKAHGKPHRSPQLTGPYRDLVGQIARYRDELRSRGIDLWVVLLNYQGLEDFRSMLDHDGVRTIFVPLDDSWSFENDAHLTPQSHHRLAEIVADSLSSHYDRYTGR